MFTGNYQIYKPSSRLCGMVSHYWSLDNKLPDDGTCVHRTLANFQPELIFHYGSAFKEIVAHDKIENAFIGGLHAQTDLVRRFTYKEQCGIFGIVLQPFAIPVLFKIPSSEVKDQLVDLQLLLGDDGATLKESILNAGSNTDRVHLAEKFLENRLRDVPRPEILFAVHEIYNHKGLVSVKSLAEKACLSPRQFERNFKEQIGFTAKSFTRLVRFKSLISEYEKGKKGLSELTYEFGYYDQSHLIQDFKTFSGYTPRHFFNGLANEVFYAT